LLSGSDKFLRIFQALIIICCTNETIRR